MFAEDVPEIKRDSWGRYRLPIPGTKQIRSWTRVTTFAKALDETTGLQNWLCRMTAKGLAEDDALVLKTKNTSVDNKQAMDGIVRKAKELSGANVAAETGTAIHTLTEMHDKGQTYNAPPQWKAHIEGYVNLQKTSGLSFPPEHIERVVAVPELMVAGTYDRLCRVERDMTVEIGGRTFHLKKGEWVIGDVKSNKSLTYAQLSIAVQLAVYSRAKHVWNLRTEEWEDLPTINQDVGFIFHLPSNTGEAALYAIDLDRGWKAAQLCKQVRDIRSTKDLVTEIEAETNSVWADRISEAMSQEDLSKIWADANLAGEWNSKLEQLGLKRLEKLR